MARPHWDGAASALPRRHAILLSSVQTDRKNCQLSRLVLFDSFLGSRHQELHTADLVPAAGVLREIRGWDFIEDLDRVHSNRPTLPRNPGIANYKQLQAALPDFNDVRITAG